MMIGVVWDLIYHGRPRRLKFIILICLAGQQQVALVDIAERLLIDQRIVMQEQPLPRGLRRQIIRFVKEHQLH